MRTVRWDQLVLRIAMGAGVIVTVVIGVLPPAGLAAWRVGAAALIGVVLVSAIGGGAMFARGRGPLRVVVLTLSATLLPLILPGVASVWVTYLGVVAAAGAGLALLPAITLALLPTLVLALRMWWSAAGLSTVALNVGIAVAVFAFVVGRGRQREAAELAAAQQEAIRQERAARAAAQAQQAVAAQVHDVLAHTLSGLILTLQGALLQGEREGVSAGLVDRLRTANDLAREGLVDARQTVAALTSPAKAAEPFSTWLDRTIGRLRAAAEVEIACHGNPNDIPEPWTDLARSTVQEGLTNSVRHAAGAPIGLTFETDGLLVTSTGDPDTFVDRGHLGGGRGLNGLRSRATARGARVTWGPEPTGFALRLSWGDQR